MKNLTKRQSRELKLAAIAGGALIVVCLFLAWGLSTRDEQLEVGADLCPVDREKRTEYAIVLLDVSEPLIGGNAEELKWRIANIGDNLERYGRLEVFDIHDVSQAIISICRPQKVEECDPMTAPQACRGVKQAYEQSFSKRIAANIDEFLSRQRERPSSPIMEAIKDVSTLTGFREMAPGLKSLYVVSDMLQNTPTVYSHYSPPVDQDGFSEFTKHRFYMDHRPELGGVRVEVLYVLRRKYRRLQTNHHRAFWRAYFQAAGTEHMRLNEINFAGSDTSAGPGYGIVTNSGGVRKGAVRSGPQSGTNSTPTTALAANFDRGTQAYNRDDYATALREWRPLADQGNADAQLNLGLMYDNGQGVPEDDHQAVSWYRKAAEQGNTKAQANLGLMYANGEGVPQDNMLAYAWLHLAAARGNERAKKNLSLVRQNMTSDQVARGQSLSGEFTAAIILHKLDSGADPLMRSSE